MAPEQSDIVSRLRERAGKHDEYDWHSAIELEAAQDIHNLRAALSARTEAQPLGYVLVELDRINTLTERIKALAEAGSADAKSLAADAARLLEARRG